jgi:hypothetical protein
MPGQIDALLLSTTKRQRRSNPEPIADTQPE